MDEYMENLTPAEQIPCTGISLSASELTFTAEGSQTLIATVTPDGCTDYVTWMSDNSGIATVNGGVVTAIANGNATITATCGDYSASCTVNVSGIGGHIAATAVTLSAEELTIAENQESAVLTATVEPADADDAVVWNTSNPLIASVVDGIVVPVFPGTCAITATAGGVSDECAVTVEPEPIAYEWSEDATHDIDTSTGEDKGGDKYMTSMFGVQPGAYRIRNNNANRLYYVGAIYDRNGAVSGTGFSGLVDTGATKPLIFVHEELACQMRFCAHVGAGTLDNVVLERLDGVIAGDDVFSVDKDTGVVSYDISMFNCSDRTAAVVTKIEDED